jgi:HSP20 family protein
MRVIERLFHREKQHTGKKTETTSMTEKDTNVNVVRREQARAENVNERPAVAPRIDVFENDNEILLFADLPGVSKDNVRIDLEKERLTIEARRTDTQEEGTELLTEYRSFDYRRAFLVPRGIDRDKIDAELSAGVLRLKLPRADSLKPRSIPIRAT